MVNITSQLHFQWHHFDSLKLVHGGSICTMEISKLYKSWSSEWFSVDLDAVCFLGFTVHMWFLAVAISWCISWQGESKMEIGLGLKAAILFVFLGLCIVTWYFCFPVCKETYWWAVWEQRTRELTWGACGKGHFLGPSSAVWITAIGSEVWESEFLTSIANDSDAH